MAPDVKLINLRKNKIRENHFLSDEILTWLFRQDRN